MALRWSYSKLPGELDVGPLDGDDAGRWRCGHHRCALHANRADEHFRLDCHSRLDGSTFQRSFNDVCLHSADRLAQRARPVGNMSSSIASFRIAAPDLFVASRSGPEEKPARLGVNKSAVVSPLIFCQFGSPPRRRMNRSVRRTTFSHCFARGGKPLGTLTHPQVQTVTRLALYDYDYDVCRPRWNGLGP